MGLGKGVNSESRLPFGNVSTRGNPVGGPQLQGRLTRATPVAPRSVMEGEFCVVVWVSMDFGVGLALLWVGWGGTRSRLWWHLRQCGRWSPCVIFRLPRHWGDTRLRTWSRQIGLDWASRRRGGRGRTGLEDVTGVGQGF